MTQNYNEKKTVRFALTHPWTVTSHNSQKEENKAGYALTHPWSVTSK